VYILGSLLEFLKRCNNTFSWRWSTWSIRPVGSFCGYLVQRQPGTVCVLSETIWQQNIIIHLSAAASRSVDYSVSFYILNAVYYVPFYMEKTITW